MSTWRTTPTRRRSSSTTGTLRKRPDCMSAMASATVCSRRRVRGSVVMYSSTGASTPTTAATSGPTRRPKMSRSVRTPARRPSPPVTKTESPVPVRWIARRQAATVVPGPTVTGSRRPTAMSGWEARAGTRAATARSVRSATDPVYAQASDRAVAPAGGLGSEPGSAERGPGVRELLHRPGPEERELRSDADEREAAGQRARGRRAVAEQDAGALPVGAADGDHAVELGEEVRVLDPARDAHRVRQVGWSDEQDVDAVDGRDRVSRVDGGGRLHLEHAEDRRVHDCRDVRVRSLPEARAAGHERHAADAVGRVAQPRDAVACLVGRADLREHDPVRAEVKGPVDAQPLHRGDAHDRG